MARKTQKHASKRATGKKLKIKSAVSGERSKVKLVDSRQSKKLSSVEEESSVSNKQRSRGVQLGLIKSTAQAKEQSTGKSAVDGEQSQVKSSTVTKPRTCRKVYNPDQAKGAMMDIADGMSVRKAAMKWQVPRTTLQDLKHGAYTPESRPGPSSILTHDEEQLLCEWIIELSRRGIPINKDGLLDSVQKILNDDPRENPFVGNRPGKGWFGAFLARHSEIAQRNSESICRARGALTENCIRGWFSDAQKFFKDHGIEYCLTDATHQFNGDETGFQVDPKSGKVLAPRGEIVYTETGGLKEQITVLVTTRADGKLMTSVIIYPYQRAVPSTIIDKMPAGFSAGRSESGWMNSEIFFEFMANIFIPELAVIRREKKGLQPEDELHLTDSDWVVFWMDGYKSHLTLHTSKLCEMNKIVLYCFKAHASHVCQPNDLGPFKPLKAEWKMAVGEWRLSNPYETLGRVNFATVLDQALKKLSPKSVMAGYRVAGLFPFDSDAVHYERLTATNRTKYDSRAFTTTARPTDSNNVNTADTDDQIALSRIETILGDDTVSVYNSLFAMPVITDTMLPNINAYFIWTHLKTSTQNLEPSSEQGIDMNELVISELVDQSVTSFEHSSAGTHYQVVVTEPRPTCIAHASSSSLAQFSSSTENPLVIAELLTQSTSQPVQSSSVSPESQLVIAEPLTQSTSQPVQSSSVSPESQLVIAEPLTQSTLSFQQSSSDDVVADDEQVIAELLTQSTSQPVQSSSVSPESQLVIAELLTQSTSQPAQSASVSPESLLVIAEPLTQSTSPPSSQEQSSACDVVVTSDGTPHKIRKGVPHWFKGKVSPAFSDHLFWPSPPKKKRRSSKEPPKILFPACATTSQWREHHRQQIAQRGAKRPSKRSVAEHETASTSALNTGLTCAKSTCRKKKKVSINDSDMPALETVDRSKENRHNYVSKPVQVKMNKQQPKTSIKKGLSVRSRRAKKGAVSDADQWKCGSCKFVYGASDDPKRCDGWTTCEGCGSHYHDTCAELSGVLEDNAAFTCHKCLD